MAHISGSEKAECISVMAVGHGGIVFLIKLYSLQKFTPHVSPKLSLYGYNISVWLIRNAPSLSW